MAGTGKSSGQRTNTTSGSGRKTRSETSTSHSGSRVEPSHITEKSREVREKKIAATAKKAAKKATKKAAKRKA